MIRPRIYISGPITVGNRNLHVYTSLEWHRILMLEGFAPFNPILTCIAPFAWQSDFPHDLWIDCDLPWVEVCDAVLRLPGESKGADEETAFATERYIPVFTLQGYSGEDAEVLLKELRSWLTTIQQAQSGTTLSPRNGPTQPYETYRRMVHRAVNKNLPQEGDILSFPKPESDNPMYQPGLTLSQVDPSDSSENA